MERKMNKEQLMSYKSTRWHRQQVREGLKEVVWESKFWEI